LTRPSSAPFSDVAIVGIHNTEQARVLPGHDSTSIAFDAAFGALADAGLSVAQVDGVCGLQCSDFIYQTGIAPAWQSFSPLGIPTLLEGVAAIQSGMASIVLMLAGGAGGYTERDSTAPWTRSANELAEPFGMITPAQFALVAQRYLHEYKADVAAFATVAATIRNNGHVNPKAVYYGRGPYTPEDILNSRMIADPYRLLDCAMTSEGGAAVVIARADIAKDLSPQPIYLLAGGTEQYGPSYTYPPRFDMGGRRRDDLTVETLGRRVWETAMRQAGLRHADIDVLELYDPYSYEIIRQMEAFGFCGRGEGGDLVMDGAIGPEGRWPVTTDGGLLSFSHAGVGPQKLQRVIRAVEQLRGTCETNQRADAEIAVCTGGGSAALFLDVLLLGRHQT
jgi:acetyl-CoA acetyltransferase